MRVILHDGYYIKKYDDGRNVSVNGGYSSDAEVTAWLAEGNMPEPAKSQEEQEAEIKSAQTAEARLYLAETDWVVTKISETAIRDEDTAPLKAKYADVLDKRPG